MAAPIICQDRLVASGALTALAERLSRHQLIGHVLLVGDDTTLAIAAEIVRAQLAASYTLTTLSLGATPDVSIAQVNAVMAAAQSAGVLLALGSGTINDICKLAAHRLGLPYICLPTAASMNGYTSANASILVDGAKRSLPATAPRAVLADMAIIAQAPLRLSRAGLGDTLCRSTVEADCLLSHFLFETHYPREGFDALRSHETQLISEVNKFASNPEIYLALLMHALLDAGDWMTQTGSSAIASQGEHMIAHCYELFSHDIHSHLHGEIIAITTATMHQLQTRFLHQTPSLWMTEVTPARFNDIFGTIHSPNLFDAYAKKQSLTAQIPEAASRLRTEWPSIRSEIAKCLAPWALLESTYQQIGIDFTAQAIGLDAALYENAVRHAHLTRDRFTFLDLAAMETTAQQYADYLRPKA